MKETTVWQVWAFHLLQEVRAIFSGTEAGSDCLLVVNHAIKG